MTEQHNEQCSCRQLYKVCLFELIDEFIVDAATLYTIAQRRRQVKKKEEKEREKKPRA